jgi:hypothetical protein
MNRFLPVTVEDKLQVESSKLFVGEPLQASDK